MRWPLRRLLRRNTTVLSGASGVGKSALINALCPGLHLRIGSLSRIRQGRHTTSHTCLVPLPGGGYVLDTPGVRSFGLAGAEPATVPFLFRDLAPLGVQCGYRNCSHRHEPDCAVQAAVAAGRIHASRYRSYRTILAEVENAAAAD